MAEFSAQRSDSSKEMRDSLMASEGQVQDIRSTVPLTRYIQRAYSLFKIALQTNSEGYISRSYVAWKIFLTFIIKLAKEHPKYKISDTSTEKFKKWQKEASDYAFQQLDDIVAQMDREEDAARREIGQYVTEEASSSDDDFLLDEFDCVDTEQKQAVPSAPQTIEQPTTSSLPSKLEILEQMCNSQVGDGPRDIGTSLYDTVTPVEDITPSSSSTMLGIKPNDRGILLHLLGGNITPTIIPPPQRLLLQLRFSTPQGTKQIAFHRHDFYISFLRFFNPPGRWGPTQLQLKASREAIETNRCFFIHLGIAINVHPFALQTYFRHVAALIIDKSKDDFQKEIVQSVLNFSGFVDANALVYIWPKEMQRCRICLISGDLRHPIFCCFYPANVPDVNSLNDIIIHSDGSHFTLLKPAVAENSASFSVLSTLLQVARSGGCIIQEIPVEMDHAANGFPTSVMEVVRAASTTS